MLYRTEIHKTEVRFSVKADYYNRGEVPSVEINTEVGFYIHGRENSHHYPSKDYLGWQLLIWFNRSEFAWREGPNQSLDPAFAAELQRLCHEVILTPTLPVEPLLDWLMEQRPEWTSAILKVTDVQVP